MQHPAWEHRGFPNMSSHFTQGFKSIPYPRGEGPKYIIYDIIAPKIY